MSLLSKIKSGLSKVGSTISSVAKKTVKAISSSANGIVQTVASVCTGNVSGVVSGIADIGSSVYNAYAGSSSSSSSSSSSNSYADKIKSINNSLINKQIKLLETVNSINTGAISNNSTVTKNISDSVVKYLYYTNKLSNSKIDAK